MVLFFLLTTMNCSLLVFSHNVWFNASSQIFVINLFYLNLPSKYLLLRILYLSLSIHTKTCQIETQKIFFEVWVVEFFRKKSQINSFMFSEKLIEAHHYTLHSKTTSHCVFHSLRIVVRYQCNIVLIKNCTNVSKGQPYNENVFAILFEYPNGELPEIKQYSRVISFNVISLRLLLNAKLNNFA